MITSQILFPKNLRGKPFEDGDDDGNNAAKLLKLKCEGVGCGCGFDVCSEVLETGYKVKFEKL